MELLITALNVVQKIVDDFSGDFSIKNTDGKYVYVNDGWIKTTGLAKDDVVGKKIEDLFPPEIAKSVQESDQRAWDSEEPIIYENNFPIKGKPVKSIVIKWVLRYKNGKVFFLCTFSDRLENREKLLAFRARIEHAMEEVKNSL